LKNHSTKRNAQQQCITALKQEIIRHLPEEAKVLSASRAAMIKPLNGNLKKTKSTKSTKYNIQQQ